MVDNTSLTSKKSSGKPSVSARGNPASSMAELMAKFGSNLQLLQKGQTVTGTIKKLTPQEILMDIGAKGDALVIEYDKQNLDNLLLYLKVGDVVRATVISAESEEGFPVVSLRRTLDDIIFEKINKFAKLEESLEVEVGDVTRGGYFAQTSEGVRGFLPSSQLIDNTGGLSGKKIQVKILEVDRSKKRVVFSQKALSYLLSPDEIGKLFKKDDIVEGEISSVTPYGLFLSITINAKKGVKNLPDGSGRRSSSKTSRQVEGFIHISEISYERVDNLDSQFKKGDKIRAQVIEVDSSNRRVNLSIKRTQKDKFLEAKSKYKAEDKVKGTVSRVSSRGIMLTLEEGISGFISSDKIPINTSDSQGKPTAGYNVGDIVNCEVVDIDERRRVIILSPVLKAVPIGYR